MNKTVPFVSGRSGVPTTRLRGHEQDQGEGQMVTNGAWLTSARMAFFAKRDLERARARELALALANMLGEVLGVDIAMQQVSGPSVVLDGVRFTIHDHVTSGTTDERSYRLAVTLVCAFCERDNEREFDTLAELGQILCEPSGACRHCQKPLHPAG